MNTARDVYRRSILLKRMGSPLRMTVKYIVPSYGILSTGRVYVKYVPESKQLIKSVIMPVHLEYGVSAAVAAELVLPVIRRLLWVIQQLKEDMDDFCRRKTAKVE
ncbi:hypothetical protein GPECTOR_8g106 [Gonium pectorale]|uniref:Uncharacterized protein n=1 Tax=Gonium pectorale TaxID=33097 RepID=A0A150GSC8_GONPE|nr:hypothetical protein GPECTOR_8g106 [Gonium pectorale]|eukprot:KXZ52711.1 hypothetical protein GPECTOR_8g106 [Gonium pectorale]